MRIVGGWRKCALCWLVLALFGAGCSSSVSENSVVAPAVSEPEVSLLSDEAEQTVASEPTYVSKPDDWNYFRADVRSWLLTESELTQEFGHVPVLLEPGSYSTTALGLALRLELPEVMRLELESGVGVVLADPNSQRLFAPAELRFGRIEGYPDPLLIGIGGPSPPPVVDGYSFDEWVAEAPQLVVDVVENVDVAGLAARRYEISIDPTKGATWSCEPGVDCVEFPATDPSNKPLVASTGLDLMLWVVDLGEYGEFLIAASHENDDAERSATWLRLSQEIVDNLGIDELGPTPFGNRPWELGASAIVPAGTVELPIGPGVRFETVADYLIYQRKGWSYLIIADGNSSPANVEVVAAPFDLAGEPITSVAQLVAMLEAVGGVVTGTMDIAGTQGTIVELYAVRPGQPVFLQQEPFEDLPTEPDTWWTQDFVRFVVFEWSGGVMGVTAEAESAEVIEQSVAVQEGVMASLELLNGG